MAIHLMRDLEHLKLGILEIGSLVEDRMHKAIVALVDRDPDLARAVIQGDDEIDAMEVKIEEECLKALALHQPVATDLRFVIMVLKVNNDLERAGDLAVNVAQRARFLCKHPPLDRPLNLRRMSDTVRAMMHDSLESLIRMDEELARKVCHDDSVVDDLHRDMFGILEGEMKRSPDNVERATQLLSASRYLERIADLATNIAEDVIFLTAGEVVRHNADLYE